MKLAKLKTVELRDYWKHEALDFTKWLAEPENLQLLGDEIGLDISLDTSLIQTEYNVGRFSVDILAQEEMTEKKIVIENQLETTDHSHLGQILTYAAGIDAEYIVWVVKDARDEHRQAIEWLNEHTNDKLNFFLVKIELWQIEDSDLAPKFSVLCRPNDWAKTIRGSNGSEKNLSATKLKQLEFWQQFNDYRKKHDPLVKLRAPRGRHWHDVAIGRSDCHISLVVMFSENRASTDLYISKDKNLYASLFSNKENIEAALDIHDLVWEALPAKKACRIRNYKIGDLSSESGRLAIFEWMTVNILKYKEVFSKKWIAQ